MLKLHVVFAIDRAGLVGDDGETHHGVFDAGFLYQVPGLLVLSPASTAELEKMLRWAVNCYDGPVAIRYPRGGNGAYAGCNWEPDVRIVSHRRGTAGAIVTYGTLVNEALAAADLLAEQGIEVSVLRLTALKPLPAADLEAALVGQRKILIAEEAMGGIAAPLSAMIRQLFPDANVDAVDLGDEYVTHGSVPELYKKHGLDGASLADRFTEVRQS